MKPVLFLSTVALSGLAAGQALKIPRPQPIVPDVKTPVETATDNGPEIPRGLAEDARRIVRPAKSAQPAVDRAPHIDFSVVRYDTPGDGALWVRGRTYKASFDERAATYIPAFGSLAPHNFPVRVETVAARVGESALDVTSRGWSRSGDDVTISRAAMREVWHLATERAEQTFVFDALPATGELEIDLSMGTELAAREFDGGIELACEHGDVRIGRATAIDARGQRVDLPLQLAEGRVRIVVPAAFTAHAALPLVVDPVYSTNALSALPNECALPDISGGGQNGWYAATYQYSFSATDSDVWTEDVYYGIPQGTGAWVDYTGASWGIPHIAYNAAGNTFCVVAQRRSDPSQPAEIWVRARPANSNVQYEQKLVQSNIAGSCFYPDIGGDPALSGPTYFLTAWTRNFAANDWDIHARLLLPDGTPVGSPIFVSNSSAFDWHPSVSKTDGRPPFSTQEWNIVWMRGDSYSDVWGAQIHWDGTVTTPAFPVQTSAFFDDTYPSASSLLDGVDGISPRPWMVCYQRYYTSTAESDVMAEVYVGSTRQTSIDVSTAEDVLPYESQSYSDVDSDGQRFVCIYSETYAGDANDNDVYETTLHYVGGAIGVDEAHVLVDFSSDNSYGAQISSCVTESNQGFWYYGQTWPLYGSNDIYVGAYYEPWVVTEFCVDGVEGTCPCGSQGSCLNSTGVGGHIYVSGNPFVSHDDFALSAFNLPSTATCLFFQGTTALSTAVPFGDGLRCIGGSIVRIATKTASNGVAVYPTSSDQQLSLRGGIPSDGGFRAYQVWYRNSAPFCTPATFNVTTGEKVLWLR